jgi:hypothetical protein
MEIRAVCVGAQGTWVKAAQAARGLRFLKLWPVLRGDQRIDGELFLFDVRLQMEAVGQQGLEHPGYLVPADAGWNPCHNVEALGIQPGGPGDLRALQAIRFPDEIAEGDVGVI